MSLKRNILTFFLISAVLVSCSKKEEKKENTINAPQGATTPIEKQYPVLQRMVTALKITDNDNWINGISVKDSAHLVIQINREDFTPFDVGYKLKFALSGEAEVLKISRVEIKERSNIFVTVNKPLDPVGDGNPNPIIVKGFTIRPANANKEKVWRNGINLEQKGVFVFWLKKPGPSPIEIGDRLRFASTGEALVKKVSIFGGTAVVITVEKILNPDEDGYPNTIEVFTHD